MTKALNDHPDIAIETKRRVREVADQMGYIPNRLGRQLATSQTMTLGLVIPKIAHSFFARALENMYEAAFESGYDLIPMVTFEDPQREEKSLRSLLSMRVDGLIVDCTAQSTIALYENSARKAKVPLVFFDRMPQGQTQFSALTCDNIEVVAELIKAAYGKGYRRLAHLAGHDSVNIGHERRRGFEIACRALALEIPKARIVVGGFREEDGYEGMKKLLSQDTKSDFVFAVNDSVAQGAYRAIGEAGLSIPDDIAIAGFGDIDRSQLLNPALTSCHIPIQDMSNQTVDLLIAHIQNPNKASENIKLPTELILRDSM